MATGSIITSLGEENNTGPADSIDVVFTTYWQYPAKVRIILPEDKACIKKYRKLHTGKQGNVSLSLDWNTSAVSFFFLPSAPTYLTGRGFAVRSIHRTHATGCRKRRRLLAV